MRTVYRIPRSPHCLKKAPEISASCKVGLKKTLRFRRNCNRLAHQRGIMAIILCFAARKSGNPETARISSGKTVPAGVGNQMHVFR